MTPVEALREIARLRLATDEGSLRVRADRIDELASSVAAATRLAVPAGEDAHADEFMSVSITCDGVVTAHNAYDADFDEMVEATGKIIADLQERYANRLKCPFAAGAALREEPGGRAETLKSATADDTPHLQAVGPETFAVPTVVGREERIKAVSERILSLLSHAEAGGAEGWRPWHGEYDEDYNAPLEVRPADQVMTLRRDGRVNGPWAAGRIEWHHQGTASDIMFYRRHLSASPAAVAGGSHG